MDLFAITDVETTGGTPTNSRITDISIFLSNGKEVVDEFSSLVNPGQFIPPFIAGLTGIDNDMVANAPAFDEIARQVLDITDRAVFVAHNVNFDYGMIKREFLRCQIPFEREKLCTIRLARSWFPGHKSYGLGRICGDLGIPIRERHRAKGDAEATTELFHRIYALSGGTLSVSDQKWIKNLPGGLDKSLVLNLPRSPGIIYLFDEGEQALFLAASANMFKKATGLVESKSKKSQELISKTRDIDFDTTGSELIASLKLGRAIKKHQPVYNKLPKEKARFFVRKDKDCFGYCQLFLTKSEIPSMSVSFKSKKEAAEFLRQLRGQYFLCAKMCGLDQSACGTNPAGQCPGACQGKEKAERYNMRADKAFDRLQFGDLIILDKIDENEQAFVAIQDNTYLGYGVYSGISSTENVKQHLVADEPTHEKTALIRDFIKKRKGKTMKVNFRW